VIPFDSFLLDPPMLFANGLVIGRLFGDPGGDRGSVVRTLEALTMAVFWGTSISLYMNQGWTRWIWEMVGAESGRDWMLNSGVFSFDHEAAGPATHAVSAAILATYPLWLREGVRTGARWRVRATRGAGSPAPSSGSP
jgi:hypothetical protein